MAGRTAKVQCTLKGFQAFALEKLTAKRGTTMGEMAAYILERWFDDHEDFLKKYGITPEAFESAEVEREGRKASNPTGEAAND